MRHRRVIDLVPSQPVKGRGRVEAIAHRFESRQREAFDDGWGTLEQEAAQETLAPATTIIEEQARTILARNDSPDIAFDLSVNPYRGCEHGCVYCFARPTHSYLNLSPGLDFETRIIAKVNAAERLRQAFARPGYTPRLLNLGSATDAYQPVERRLGITRGVVEVLAECAHPFSVVTKSAGIERDLDLIAPLAARGLAAAYVSVTTLDGALAARLPKVQAMQGVGLLQDGSADPALHARAAVAGGRSLFGNAEDPLGVALRDVHELGVHRDADGVRYARLQRDGGGAIFGLLPDLAGLLVGPVDPGRVHCHARRPALARGEELLRASGNG